MKTITCPLCKHDHEYEDKKDVPDTPYFNCEKCVRKLRLQREGGTMVCNSCGSQHECDSCTDHVKATIICWKDEMHDWKSTLAIDFVKCAKCDDIKKITPTIES